MSDKELLLSIILTLKEYEDNLDNGDNSSDVSADISEYIGFLGNYLTKKDVKSSKCSNHGKTCDKVITVNGMTALDELENVYNFIKDPANRNDDNVDCYSRVLSNYIRLYRKELNKD